MSFTQEKLINTRNSVIKQLENTEGLAPEKIEELEKTLNDVIIKLAKI